MSRDNEEISNELSAETKKKGEDSWTKKSLNAKLKCFTENFVNGRLNPKVRDEVMFVEEISDADVRFVDSQLSDGGDWKVISEYTEYLTWRISLNEKMGVNGWTNEEIFEIEEKYYEFQYKMFRGILNPEVRDGQIKFDDNLREEEYWQMRFNEEINKSEYDMNSNWLYDIHIYVYYASGREILSQLDACFLDYTSGPDFGISLSELTDLKKKYSLPRHL